MKQIITNSRKEAIEFAEGGNGKAQRAAYWKQGGKAYRAECVPGQIEAAVTENCGGLWWSATITVAKKLGL